MVEQTWGLMNGKIYVGGADGPSMKYAVPPAILVPEAGTAPGRAVLGASCARAARRCHNHGAGYDDNTERPDLCGTQPLPPPGRAGL